jgi:hypothetical protein
VANPNPSPETRFKPGNPGGPGRKPGTKMLSTLLREALAEADEDDAKAIVRALIREARTGSIAHIKEVFDRTDGKATEADDDDRHADAQQLLDRIAAIAEAGRAPRDG